MYADDAAETFLFFMENYDSAQIIRIGRGDDISIKELAALIAGNIETNRFTGNMFQYYMS